MPHVLVVQHEPSENLGALAPALAAAGLEQRVVRPFLGEPIPQSLAGARGLVVLGGGMSAVPPRTLRHLDDEIALLRGVAEARAPVLGLCLGSQLLAAALGGTVSRAPAKELGFLRVRLNPAAREDALFAEVPTSFVAFHWHEDVFTLPPGAIALARSTAAPLQAFRAGTAWGIQFHPEVTPEILAAMLASAETEVHAAGADPDQLLEAAARELPRMDAWRAPLFARWTALVRGAR
jgi:GMP synthase (glutamine-hydrolysing)